MPAGAHRLDEYLQATRLSIDIDRVNLDIDLTPGVSVASRILGWMDTNGDGEISTAESEAYARQVLSAVALSVDGRAVPITFVDNRFPNARDMTAGIGTIRLRATSKMPPASSGRHQLAYVNDHRSDLSVYLVNALVPADPRIRITDQRRDPAQHRLTLDYDVTTPSASSRTAWLLAGLAAVGLLAVTRRASARRTSCRSTPTGLHYVRSGSDLDFPIVAERVTHVSRRTVIPFATIGKSRSDPYEKGTVDGSKEG